MVPVLLLGFIGYKQGAVAPEGTRGPLIFVSKFKLLYFKQSIGSLTNISVQVLF